MKLKIGIVNHLNARPLTYGFENDPNYNIVKDTPAQLKKLLLQGELDAALISSVECLRNPQLDFSTTTGVCCRTEVASILFFQNRDFNPAQPIFTDSGSRSSVALLQVLFWLESASRIGIQETDPQQIRQMMDSALGSHLLIGDNALRATANPQIYTSKDLASWWNALTGLPFCFAFWAYPKNSKLDDSIFSQSLQQGLANMDKIIAAQNEFAPDFVRKYLTGILHYQTDSLDIQGFELFRDKCAELGLV